MTGSRIENLILIREFLGPSPSAIYGKLSKHIVCDDTVGTKEIKLYHIIYMCRKSVSWDLL